VAIGSLLNRNAIQDDRIKIRADADALRGCADSGFYFKTALCICCHIFPVRAYIDPVASHHDEILPDTDLNTLCVRCRHDLILPECCSLILR
jgi:hypothetical protein